MVKILSGVVLAEVIAFMLITVLGALSWLSTVATSWVVDVGDLFFGNLVVCLLLLIIVALAINKSTQKAAGCTVVVLICALVLVYGGELLRVILGFSTTLLWAPFNSFWVFVVFTSIVALIGVAWALGDEPNANGTNPTAVDNEPRAE